MKNVCRIEAELSKMEKNLGWENKEEEPAINIEDLKSDEILLTQRWSKIRD